MKQKCAPDALIFDIDGVLLDVRFSFPEVIRSAVFTGWERFCGGVSDCRVYGPEHERIMKRHGAFNDDFDLSWALLEICLASGERKLSAAFPTPARLEAEVATFEGTVPEWLQRRYHARIKRSDVHELCHELYGYDGKGGLHKLETPLVQTRWNEMGLPVGIYTGRNLIEWGFAKECLGWEDFPLANVVHSETGVLKPSPAGINMLCEKFGAKCPVMFGDTASDMMAWQACGRGFFVAIGDLLPEAEYVFENTQDALEAVLKIRGGILTNIKEGNI